MEMNGMNVDNITNTNFKGTFVRNIHLDKAIEKASDYDLYKFSKLLNRMKAKDDNRYFEIFEYVTIGDETIISFLKCKPYSSKFYNVGKGPKDSKNGEKTCYDDIINAVNLILEKIYPEPRKTKIPRETSIRRILDIVS